LDPKEVSVGTEDYTRQGQYKKTVRRLKQEDRKKAQEPLKVLDCGE
jgi:hypothetical protein